MESHQITDLQVHLAMRGLADNLKGKGLEDIQSCDELYSAKATNAELQAYGELWADLISLMETRWSISGRKRILNMGNGGLVATPLSLVGQILGTNYEKSDRTDLLCQVSERLMISSFAAFKRIHGNDAMVEGLSNHFVSFMFTAFCFELRNRARRKWKGSGIPAPLSLDAPVAKDSSTVLMDTIEDHRSAYCRGVLLILTLKDEEVPVVICIDDTSLKEFQESLLYSVTEGQRQIMEYHLRYLTGDLILDDYEKLIDHITRELNLSHDAYYTQMTRIRKSILDHFSKVAEASHVES